jgi:S-(hydroxymethyl)glutathione dehydrogenase/alcohol dehydrogenase
MKAVVYHRPGKMSVDTVPDPQLVQRDDIIVRVTATAICGSDLHIYNGFIPQAKPMIMGHEFMGIVEEAGQGVTALKKGDRVVVLFNISCGHCFYCNIGQTPHCERSNPGKYGPEGGLLEEKGGGLYGYTDLYGGYDGGQAQYARVPYANFGPRKVSDAFTDEQVLFLTDIFPTGYRGIEWAQLQGGETVAVFGCGPVGLMAQKVAWLKGAKRVIAIDKQEYRLETARRTAKSETINFDKTDAVAAIRDMTEGRGADVCVDAVGMEADRTTMDKVSNAVHMQGGTLNAFKLCASAVRRGGRISILGVYATPFSNFPLGQLFDKGVSLFMGQAQVQPCIDELITWVEDGRIVLNDIISHRLPLDQAPHAYQIFRDKEDACVKVVLNPWN